VGTGSNVKTELREYLDSLAPTEIGEREWIAIRERFSGTSPGYLRRLLRDSGRRLAPLVEGVRQESFAELERTLLALEALYTTARETGNRDRSQACRDLVLEAKSHAQWGARRATDPAKRDEKLEMVEWLRIWLEYPSAFRPWVRLRQRTLGERE
jgi:hypothetical protein